MRRTMWISVLFDESVDDISILFLRVNGNLDAVQPRGQMAFLYKRKNGNIHKIFVRI